MSSRHTFLSVFIAVFILSCGQVAPGGTGGGSSTGGGDNTGGGANTGGGSDSGGGQGGGDSGGGAGGGDGSGGGTSAGGGNGGAGGSSAGGGSASGGGTADEGVSFSKQVAPLFKSSCNKNCHEGAWHNDTASVYARLTGKTSSTTTCKSQDRMVAGNSKDSLVVKKISGTQTCGGKMPQVSTGASTSRDCKDAECMPQKSIDTIKQWIDEGAKNN